jgi:ATP phosphoribosyltransferase regulatory subunit
MNRWLLPEDIADVLPSRARKIEELRRRALDLYQTYGYELVNPPLLEFLDSLLTGTGSDLNLQTFKLVDQLSGRTLGLRADITPQVARIDAHLLNREGVTRLCYAGSVAHVRAPAGSSSREELQIGAEIYGHAGWEADLEALSLLLQTLNKAGLKKVYLDLSHAGVLKGILGDHALNASDTESLYAFLQTKDRSGLSSYIAKMPPSIGKSLIALIELNGACAEVLVNARSGKFALPKNPVIEQALNDLARLSEVLSSYGVELSIDLADLRGYQYHSGVMFAAYVDGLPQPIARGGRYDHVGQAFGRSRPATGFSLDLYTLADYSNLDVKCSAIIAPWSDDQKLLAMIADLRSKGEVVIQLRKGDEARAEEFVCDRELIQQGASWQVQAK